MSEKRECVRTIRVRYYCKCGTEMELREKGRQTDSWLFDHWCPKCGVCALLPRVYPAIDYEPLENHTKYVSPRQAEQIAWRVMSEAIDGMRTEVVPKGQERRE